MFVYIDEEGFDEEHIKAPILRPFLMYSMFSATLDADTFFPHIF